MITARSSHSNRRASRCSRPPPTTSTAPRSGRASPRSFATTKPSPRLPAALSGSSDAPDPRCALRLIRPGRDSFDPGVAQWQRSARLERLEHEACAHVLEFHRVDQPLVDDVICIDVGNDDADQVIDIAAHAVDLGHLLNLPYRAHELLEPPFAVIAGLESHEHRRAHIERVRIEQCDRAPDDTVALKLLNAPPARGFGQPDAIADLGGGELGVALQQIQNPGIELIHGIQDPIWRQMRNIVADLALNRHAFATPYPGYIASIIGYEHYWRLHGPPDLRWGKLRRAHGPGSVFRHSHGVRRHRLSGARCAALSLRAHRQPGDQ